MKTNRIILSILVMLISVISCKKDDDNGFEEIIEPIDNIEGSLWINSGNAFTELDLKDNQPINSFTTLDSFRCTEFDGTFICTQGEYTGTKTVMRKGTFNGELIWSKDYEANVDGYFKLNATKVHQNTLFVSYEIINSTTFISTYHLEALDLDTGDVKWNIELVDQVKRITEFKNQIIAELTVGSSTTEILSINTIDGHIDNRTPFTDRIGKIIGGSTSILIMTWSNSVVSLDDQLNVNWTFETGSPNILGGYEIDDQFIFYSRDKSVYSIDSSTGNLIWRHTYTGNYPLAINVLNDKVYVGHRKEAETNIHIMTLDLYTGEELDSFTYITNEEFNSSATKYFFFDQHLLLFNIVPADDKANIVLINIKSKATLWEKTLAEIAYSHLVITPTGYYQ